jgi:hypothetical protein
VIAVLWVALGGALGSVARYGAGLAAARLLGLGFPWGTDWESNPKGKLSASERRVLTAKFAQKAMAMINSPHQRELTINAATRTGLRMEISENFDKIVPVR